MTDTVKIPKADLEVLYNALVNSEPRILRIPGYSKRELDNAKSNHDYAITIVQKYRNKI